MGGEIITITVWKLFLLTCHDFNKTDVHFRKGNIMRRFTNFLLHQSVFLILMGLFLIIGCGRLNGPPKTVQSDQIVSGIWNGERVQYIDRQIVIAVTDQAAPDDINNLFHRFHLTVVKNFDKLGTALVEVPESADLMPTIESLNNHPFIRYAEPNLIATITVGATAAD